ncbi:hypothetical protein BDV23DRAFT_158579 [Aspergillus alliaceus]|uniref:Uncharacterized protein n=1 Tax=Petromyces alliaceus TaxID=209559 RepID=A0A5N7C3M3_PETAA|nr:hypothetical protein BDV23DRAFT_158579 [Aspergillus alliaceus]
MSQSPACVQQNVGCHAYEEDLHVRRSLPPLFLPPLLDDEFDADINIPPASLLQGTPGHRFEHGQVTPPLDNARVPPPSVADNWTPSRLHDDVVLRQWLSDMPSAAQRLLAADLTINKSCVKSRQSSHHKVVKAHLPILQNRRASTGTDVRFGNVLDEKYDNLAELLSDLHL